MPKGTLAFDARAALAHLRSREAAMVRLLGEFVRSESFSYEKKAIDAFGAQVAREWRARGGAAVRVLKNRERGNSLRIEVAATGARRRGQLLVIGHLDTVYPLGSLR
jgi:acetylornithine deacetylase/succinyl-diaminopimelate desuccinylase-like protein